MEFKEGASRSPHFLKPPAVQLVDLAVMVVIQKASVQSTSWRLIKRSQGTQKLRELVLGTYYLTRDTIINTYWYRRIWALFTALFPQNSNVLLGPSWNCGERERRDNYLHEDFTKRWKMISTACLVWKFRGIVALTRLKLWPTFTDMISSNSYSPHQPKKMKGTQKGTLHLLF